mgnify:CR=1 FL=1
MINSNNVSNLSIGELAGISFDCGCGRKHSADISKIIIGRGALGEIQSIAAIFRQGKILIAADSNTYEVCGRTVEKLLADGDFNIRTFVFNTPHHHLVPDERAVGRLLIEAGRDVSFILAVGSGVLNDLAKYASYKTGIPFMIAATAPSMDGYASVVSPLVVDGIKITAEGVYPVAIVADTDILKGAPMEMIRAGFGDIAGKITALADWELARRLKEALYCETCAEIVRTALNKCTNSIDGIIARDEESIRYLMEGLVLSGIAIGFHGDSTPASGSEHSFAHYWDMDAISRNVEHPLHGNSVAVGTVVTSYAYEIMKPYLPDDFDAPDPEKVAGLLRRIGSCDGPRMLGIGKDLFIRSVHNAYKLKSRYIIFKLAEEKGMLGVIADALAGRFYD